MKRKTRSNLIMVVLIAVIMVAGMIGAYFLMGDQSGFQLGTLFSGADLTDETGEYTCTITIRCDTVLSNKGKLNEAKVPYIPADGVILAQVTAAFTPGETVMGFSPDYLYYFHYSDSKGYLIFCCHFACHG